MAVEDTAAPLEALALAGRGPVIPVVVIDRVEHAVPMARALVEGGVTVIEVTLRTPAALASIEAIARAVPEAIVGAGTLRHAADARSAHAAGARFAVSPGYSGAVAAACRAMALPLLPGVATASEIMRAYGIAKEHNLTPPVMEQPQYNMLWRRRFEVEYAPLYKELGPENGKGYAEVEQALGGLHASMVRVNDRGEVIVSVAVPVQRFRAVRGALMLSTQGADIDDMVEAERLAIVKVFLVAAAVMVVLSMLLAGTIAGPVRRLADGAERVRRRIRSRVEIPDFTRRRDEIGDLSGALREMTNALYTRIEAIESFAADVAHELRNPLTSLRSAVETLPLAKTDDSRRRLLEVIEHDVKRLDRLISDISDASRLDAELQRQEAAQVDFAKLLDALVTAANEIRTDDVNVTLAFEGGSPAAFKAPGHDSRLGQVVSNLIDNARSFSPPGGTVRITCRRLKNEIEIVVDDDGPGIRPEALDKIFERFYTDRPHQGFGQNSGLGLSISKQIVEAHGGSIRVENRTSVAAAGQEPRVLGARFVVRLPAM